MKQTARLWLRIWSVIAAISAAAVCFAALKGYEPLLAAALTALVFSGLMAPVGGRTARALAGRL